MLLCRFAQFSKVPKFNPFLGDRRSVRRFLCLISPPCQYCWPSEVIVVSVYVASIFLRRRVDTPYAQPSSFSQPRLMTGYDIHKLHYSYTSFILFIILQSHYLSLNKSHYSSYLNHIIYHTSITLLITFCRTYLT